MVGVAVPVTLALTLALSYFFGYTLNRVTLFALIFAIGILVDDAIVVVENIHRHFQLGWTTPTKAAVYATDEVGNPTILATLTVIASLLPLAFVSGLMGPYMRPIPINASAAMFISLLVAFVVTPYLALRLLRGHAHSGAGPEAMIKETPAESRIERVYAAIARPLIRKPKLRHAALAAVLLLLAGSIALVGVRAVRIKMLPYDNKSEFQVVIDMPEGTTLEQTKTVSLRPRRRDPAPARGHRSGDLRRDLGADQLQRTGPALFPAERSERRGHPGESGRQAIPQEPEPRHRQEGADATHADRRAVRRADQGGRGAARPPRPIHDGGRDLRTRLEAANRDRRSGEGDLRRHARHRRCGLVRAGSAEADRFPRRPGSRRTGRHHAGDDRPEALPDGRGLGSRDPPHGNGSGTGPDCAAHRSRRAERDGHPGGSSP